MNNWFKRNGVHLAIIGIFIALCFVYFSPALQGKALYQSDVLMAQGMQKEIMDIKAKDGKGPLWTNSMFGGMPAFQIWVQYPNNVTTYVISFFKTVFPNPIDTVLLYLLGAYLLFCVLRMNPWLAAAGAIAFAFSSYNFQIIDAGHSNKALAIAFFPPILAGIIMAFRRQYLIGAVLTALFLAIEIRTNHIQMTYYLFIALLIYVGIELYHAVKTKTTQDFLKSFGYLAAAVLLAIAVNAGMLWTSYEYGAETIRGKSNLKTEKSEPNNGLDREYAYQWSQGLGESLTFLVPNAYGGASGAGNLDENSEVAKTLATKGIPAEQLMPAIQQLSQIGLSTYWGDKQFTSGPWYFGAIICFLFILGLFIVKNRIKWWILSASLLCLILSFGRHLPFLSDLFFDYFPLYNKFRAVESILVITAFLIPVLAILAVKEVAFHTEDPKKLNKSLLNSLYITAGLLLILIAVPTVLLDFKTQNHTAFIEQLTQVTNGDRAFADSIAKALVDDRINLARMDALRSLFFVLVGAGLIWALIRKKMNPQVTFIILAAVILVDMWNIDRRYLNNEKFVDKSVLAQQFKTRDVDQLIQRDGSYYRVLDLASGNPFSNSIPSYFHKSIGGYHAAKLKRYQEVLDKQFNGAINEDVLDMLNTKYLITSDQNGQKETMVNRSTAAGNAWFVQNVEYVKSADEEMIAISSFDPKKVMVVHEEFKPLIDIKKVGYDGNAFIRLTNYHPDHMTYEYSSGRDALAVFSEIWYDKGWNAYVDGEKIPYFRADYLLRAAQLPGGNHKLEFKFEPTSYYTGETISLIASILLILGLAYAIYTETRNKNLETGKA
ncbi:YfhO family protein [Daejeonella sp.]|uniref:YfhO family protein n=1 Tax=Daejeonella sp. TaxID=2805397 RepID=UPI002CA3231E|nr:YfhO family protein [Daejeonella sp.]HQT24861.1 YfhO family protein [Daejeonella sp.]HQT59529.1 YfhO family protein [Daejeonella sp.]